MRNKVVFIIPYFGKKPDYFDLWLQSAEKNSQYNFFIFTDVEIETDSGSNVKIFKMTFEDVVALIVEKINMKVKLKRPYKLCDFKPAYGLIFEDYIEQFDYWGFCDVDLILGDISSFVNDSILLKYDKMYSLGHFCLMKNNEKYKMLFSKQFPKVLNYKYVFKTNYSCHFDENGTIAWAHEFDKTIRYYDKWDFYDADTFNYRFMHDEDECFFEWDNGKLFLIDSKQSRKEIMYLHLQKRAMINFFEGVVDRYFIIRNEFRVFDKDFSIKEYIVNKQSENDFYIRVKKKMKKEAIQNIKNGAMKYRIYRKYKKLLEK